MKKMLLIFCFISISFVFVSNVFAQTSSDEGDAFPIKQKFYASGFVSYNMPLGTIGDNLNSSFGGNVQFEYLISPFSPIIGITFNAGYIPWMKNADNRNLINYTYNMIPILLGARYYFIKDDRSASYGGINLGMFNRRIKLNQVTNSYNDFGFNVTGGEQFDMTSSFVLDANGCLFYIASKGESTIYLAINVGLSYRF